MVMVGMTLPLSPRGRVVFPWRRIVPYDPERMTLSLPPPPRLVRRRRPLLAEAVIFCRAWDGSSPARLNLERCLKEDWFSAGAPDRAYVVWLELYARYVAPNLMSPLLQPAARQPQAQTTFRALAYYFAVASDEWMQQALRELTFAGSPGTWTRRSSRRFREACREWGLRHGGTVEHGDDLLRFWDAFEMTDWLAGHSPHPPLSAQAFALLAAYGAGRGQNVGDVNYWFPFGLTSSLLSAFLIETASRGWLRHEPAVGGAKVFGFEQPFETYVAQVLA